MKHHSPKSLSTTRFAEALGLAMHRVGRTATTSWILVFTVIAALPLYVAGYHEGLRPLSGLILALLLGAVLLAVSVVWCEPERRGLPEVLEAVTLVLRHVGVPLAAVPVLFAAFAATWVYAWGATFPTAVVEFMTNEWSSLNKPVAHVVLGSFMAFVVSPAAFLGIAAAAPGQRLRSAVDARTETPRKSVLPLGGLLGLWGAWLLLAHVPMLGWLLVPVLTLAILLYAGSDRRRRPRGSFVSSLAPDAAISRRLKPAPPNRSIASARSRRADAATAHFGPDTRT